MEMFINCANTVAYIVPFAIKNAFCRVVPRSDVCEPAFDAPGMMDGIL